MKKEFYTIQNLHIQNGNGDQSKYQEYVDFENGKVNQLSKILAEYVKEKNKTMKTFHKLHKELYDFSIEVMNKKLSQTRLKYNNVEKGFYFGK